MARRDDRLEHLESKASPDRCGSCGGRVIFEEHPPEGGVRFEPPPCPECGSPGRIVVTFDNDPARDDGDDLDEEE